MTRKCTKCGKIYLLNKENFTSSKNCVGYLTHVCKVCTNKQKAEWKKRTGKNTSYYYKPPQVENKKDLRDKLILKTARILRKGILKRSKEINKDITTDFLYNFIIQKNKKCECCNVKLDLSYKDSVYNLSPSIDRLIPENGYVISNIALLCWKCNVIKSNASLEELNAILLWMKNEMQNS